MEKNLTDFLKEKYELPDVDIKTYSPLVLAYIGDGIYDLIIRTIVVYQGNTQANKLHRRTSELVKAATQATMIDLIFEDMTTEEQDMFRRGRNAKSPTMAKNATMKDYRKATGFEALMGYLYLKGDYERMTDLIKLGLARLEEQKGAK